jgi:hypothetical protein
MNGSQIEQELAGLAEQRERLSQMAFGSRLIPGSDLRLFLGVIAAEIEHLAGYLMTLRGHEDTYPLTLAAIREEQALLDVRMERIAVELKRGPTE